MLLVKFLFCFKLETDYEKNQNEITITIASDSVLDKHLQLTRISSHSMSINLDMCRLVAPSAGMPYFSCYQLR